MTPPHFENGPIGPIGHGKTWHIFFTITTPTQETCSLNLSLEAAVWQVVCEKSDSKACFFRKWGNEPNWDLAIQNDWPKKNGWLEVDHPKYMVTKLIKQRAAWAKWWNSSVVFQRTSVHDQKRLSKKHRWKKAPFSEWCIAKPPLFPKWRSSSKACKNDPVSNFKTTLSLDHSDTSLGLTRQWSNFAHLDTSFLEQSRVPRREGNAASAWGVDPQPNPIEAA